MNIYLYEFEAALSSKTSTLSLSTVNLYGSVLTERLMPYGMPAQRSY